MQRGGENPSGEHARKDRGGNRDMPTGCRKDQEATGRTGEELGRTEDVGRTIDDMGSTGEVMGRTREERTRGLRGMWGCKKRQGS